MDAFKIALVGEFKKNGFRICVEGHLDNNLFFEMILRYLLEINGIRCQNVSFHKIQVKSDFICPAPKANLCMCKTNGGG